ncbi:isoflavone reductase family protein [Zopfia rhizophila CBS 207.26]|uniref:Isoflavone reductase family protein n=1 Tax=Zopfia rhizophila CBS 207.26 TaxID=1314779 RepID=A0A6A6ED41_9PEZI|nr:isoflavone reductase family protein [Zopfia rhizophila CBS 207.26]
MGYQRVLLLGATGQTGGSILDGLLECGKFDVDALIRPSSAYSPSVAALPQRGVKTVIADIGAPVDELAILLNGYEIVISAIDAMGQLAQLNLATAAKKAGVKRFVPCAFISIAPPGGVIDLRDEKEVVFQHIRKLFLPYTFIDVGVWFQTSFPTLPSGRVDYASIFIPNTTLHAGGDIPNLLTDIPDIGRFVARIVDDERTLNKYVYTWSDLLSQNQVFSILEEMSGEKIERTHVSADNIEKSIKQIKAALEADPSNLSKRLSLLPAQYSYSRAVRGDNQPAYAKYLGYLDARELYPDFKPKSFREFTRELLDGKAEKPYKDNKLFERLKSGLEDGMVQ